MSSKQRQFIPFDAFSPDTVEFDNPGLEEAANVTPSYGAHRPIEKLVRQADIADTNFLTGGYAHLSGQGSPLMKVTINGDDTGLSPTMEIYDKNLIHLDDTDDYGRSMVAGFEPNDTSWIRTRKITDFGFAGGQVEFTMEEMPRTPPAPTVPGDTNLYLRVRGRIKNENRMSGDDPLIDYELYDTAGALSILSGTWTMLWLPGDDPTEWQDFEHAFTAVEHGKVTDWGALELRLNPYFTIQIADLNTTTQPLSDEYFDTGWKNSDGNSDDLFDYINSFTNAFGGSPSTWLDNYIDSPSLSKDQDATVIFRMDPLEWPDNPDGAIWNNSHQFHTLATANNENVSLRVRIVQPHAAPAEGEEDDETYWEFSGQNFKLLAEEELPNIGTDQTTPTPDTITAKADDDNIIASRSWIDNMDPTKNIYLALTATYGGSGSGGASTTVDVDPENSDIAQGSGDGAYEVIKVPSGGNNRSKLFTMETGPPRHEDSNGGNHVIHVRARSTSGDLNLRCGLKDQGGNTAGGSGGGEVTLTSSFAWHTKTLKSGDIKALIGEGADYANLSFDFRAQYGEGTVDISECYLRYPSDTGQARVYASYGIFDAMDHLQMSWIVIESDDPKATQASDFNVTIVGTETDLYEATKLGFAVLTKGGAGSYGASGLNSRPTLWDFTSWGDDIIATNYADPIQRSQSGGVFADLITSTDKPQARYCAVVGSQLILGDINPASPSYTSGKPFHLWCSYLTDPTKFALADYDNQSALFPLVSKAGGITGILGGEFGWVFQRNAVWRVTYVGLPPMYQFDLVVEGVGCNHPQSIVSAHGQVYFWGGGAIHSVGPQGYRKLSGQRIEKYLFDNLYETRALRNQFSALRNENESMVWGAYDSYSGLIWWLYRTNTDSDQQKLNNAIVYSVTEDRFTTFSEQGVDMNLIVSQQNVMVDTPVLNRSMQAFQHDDTNIVLNGFTDETTYSGTLKTKIMTPSAWGGQIGRDAEITAVRPMYTSQPDVDYATTELPNFSITIEGAQDPSMRIGYDARTVDRIRENRQGWIPVHPMTAEFWRFTVNYPELYRSTIKEFLGLQVMSSERGDG